MFNTLKETLKIDLYYSINSFIYIITKFPILKDLFTGNPYKNKDFKHVISIICLIFSYIKKIVFRALYFISICLIAGMFKHTNFSVAFINIYLIFAIIGLFINNNLLNSSIKKYYCVILFNINAKKYVKAYLFYNTITSFILNVVGVLIISLITNLNILLIILLPLLSLLTKISGEALNILYYKKYKTTLSTNTKLYFSIIIISFFLLFLLLQYNISINLISLIIIISVLIFLTILALKYINNVKDYKLIYKQINTKTRALTEGISKAYSRQAITEVKDKDKVIDNKKIKNKKGYDLFNTIFFERHKQILLRSARNYAIIALIISLSIIAFMIADKSLNEQINKFLMNNLAWFVIIMYFINRGAIITQAMFYNCDHAMLTFNFYRNKDVILNLFKKRLGTLIKVNLIPTSIIALALPIILYLSGGSLNPINYLTIPLFIIVVSIFFSVHYLVIYYLLQPYNKDMQMKSVSYSIVSMLTYFASYILTDFKMSTSVFALLGLIVTVTYIIVALLLVYKKAPKTFRIK